MVDRDPVSLPRYVQRISRHLPSPSENFDYAGKRSKTPPYIRNDPEIGDLDLAKIKPLKLVLFSEGGVDDIVQSLHCPPNSPRRTKPGQVMAQLVFSHSAPYAENEFGHAIEPGWVGPDGNRAMDVLANLLGGTTS